MFARVQHSFFPQMGHTGNELTRRHAQCHAQVYHIQLSFPARLSKLEVPFGGGECKILLNNGYLDSFGTSSRISCVLHMCHLFFMCYSYDQSATRLISG